MKSKQFKPSTLSFHQEQCIHHLLDDASCHFCIDACPYQALTLNEGKIHIQSKLCQDCGRCVNTCPSSAFYLNHPINHYDDNIVLFACQAYPLSPKLSKNMVRSSCYMGLNIYDLVNLVSQNKNLVFLYDEALCQSCHQFHKDFLLEALEEIFMPFQTEVMKPLFIDKTDLADFLKNHTPNIYQPTKRRMLLKSSFRFALNTSINYLGDQINLASLRESQMQHSNLLDYKWQTLRTLKESYPLKPGTFLPLLSIKASCCTFCGHCVRICPTKALTVIRKDKRLLVWTPTKCENCNFCIEACPKHYLDFNLPLRTSILLEKTHYILWQEEPYQL